MSDFSSQKKPQQVSGAQIRAARALLGISSKELSEMAKTGWATIRRFEQVDSIGTTRSGTLDRVKETLEAAGIEFIGDAVTSPGVRLHRNRD